MLIDAERDDDALLEAEDAAIRAAAKPAPTVEISGVVATPGSDLALLLENLNAGQENAASQGR